MRFNEGRWEMVTEKRGRKRKRIRKGVSLVVRKKEILIVFGENLKGRKEGRNGKWIVCKS